MASHRHGSKKAKRKGGKRAKRKANGKRLARFMKLWRGGMSKSAAHAEVFGGHKVRGKRRGKRRGRGAR